MAVLLLALGGGVSSFAESPALEPVTIQLRWSHQFQFAGYYAGVEKGFYAAEGLDVTLQEAVPGQDRVTPVLEGRAQYGVGDAGILKLRADGRPLVLLAQIFQHSPNILMTRRDSNIYSPYELKGKTVRLNSGPAGSAAVRAMILVTLGGLDQVTIIPRHYADEEFTGGKADAVAGYLSNEPYRMKQAGLAINIIDPRSYGIDFYGDNLFTTEQEIASHPERVEKVRRATLKGWAYALKNKGEIIDLILSKYNNPNLNREKLDFEAKVIDQMVLADIIPIGEVNLRRYARITEIYHRLGMSPSTEVPEGFIYRPKPSSADLLTKEERAWIIAHPDINFVMTDDYKPCLIVSEDGSQSGILVDLIDLLNQRLGTKIKIVANDFESYLKMIERGEVDGVPSMSPAAVKRRHMLSTVPHFTVFPTLFAWQGESTNVSSLRDLAGKRCAIVGGFPAIEKLLAPYADQVAIDRAKSTDGALRLLFEGKVDFFLGFSPNTYQIAVNNFTGLVPVLTLADHRLDAVMGVRKEWPELVGILNKGLASITEAEKLGILARWSALPIDAPTGIMLSDDERAWLSKNIPIRVGVADFPPFVILSGNQPAGLSLAYLDLIAKRTGLQFRYKALKRPQFEVLEELGQGLGPDLIPSPVRTAEPRQDILFTNPYARSPIVIFSTQDGPLITALEDLSGKVVGMTRASALHEAVMKTHPNLNVRLFDSEKEALQALEERRVDASIGNLSVGTYFILENEWSNIKIAAPSGLEDQVLSFGIRQDWPELRGIIDKGLDSISPEERNGLRNQYLSVHYDHSFRDKNVAKRLLIIGSIFALCIGAIVYWNVLLARKVTERTADLDLTNKRLSAEVDQRRNTEKALRTSRDYLDNLTNSMADIVVSVRLPDRTIEWVNDAIKQLGYEPDECIGRTTEFIYADLDDFMVFGKKMEQSMARNREDIVAEFMFKKKNGDIFPAETTISFFESKGDLLSVTGIIRDISERKEKEQLLDAYQQRLKALAAKLTMSEERERRRLATELHDHVGQSLAIARLQLASAKRNSSDPSCNLLIEEVSHTLLEAAQETRQLIFDLSTPAIKELGLQAALRDWLNERMPKHGIVAALMDHTDSAEALPLTDDEAALIFRHARELLTNVIKHAKANRVKVEVAAAGNEIHLAVQDNGVGFEAAGASGNGKDKGHFGLLSIKESMADLGGSLEIDAAPGKGCRAVLRLPVIDKGSKVQG